MIVIRFSVSIDFSGLIVIELTYVELLEYSFGKVYFSYPNDYGLIQTSYINDQVLNFNLISDRTIDSLQITSHSGATITNNTNNAQIYLSLPETPANADYEVNYSLSLAELGLFGFSTFLPDSVVPDQNGHGFFTFIVAFMLYLRWLSACC